MIRHLRSSARLPLRCHPYTTNRPIYSDPSRTAGSSQGPGHFRLFRQAIIADVKIPNALTLKK